GVERTFLAMMAQLDILHVVRNRPFPRGNVHDPFDRDKEKLRRWINELANQPRAGDTINFDMFTSDPFHNGLLLISLPKEAPGKRGPQALPSLSVVASPGKAGSNRDRRVKCARVWRWGSFPRARSDRHPVGG